MSGRPGRWWYLFAALLFLGGGSLSFAFGFVRLGERVAAMPRVVVPGRSVLELPRGEQVLFLESRSVIGARALHGPDDAGELACSLRRADGAPVTLRAPEPPTVYEVAGYRGRSLAVAEIEAPGAHALRCEGGRSGEVVLAIGDDLAPALVGLVLPVLGFTLSGLGLFAFVYARRRHGRAD